MAVQRSRQAAHLIIEKHKARHAGVFVLGFFCSPPPSLPPCASQKTLRRASQLPMSSHGKIPGNTTP